MKNEMRIEYRERERERIDKAFFLIIRSNYAYKRRKEHIRHFALCALCAYSIRAHTTRSMLNYAYKAQVVEIKLNKAIRLIPWAF